MMTSKAVTSDESHELGLEHGDFDKKVYEHNEEKNGDTYAEAKSIKNGNQNICQNTHNAVNDDIHVKDQNIKNGIPNICENTHNEGNDDIHVKAQNIENGICLNAHNENKTEDVHAEALNTDDGIQNIFQNVIKIPAMDETTFRLSTDDELKTDKTQITSKKYKKSRRRIIVCESDSEVDNDKGCETQQEKYDESLELHSEQSSTKADHSTTNSEDEIIMNESKCHEESNLLSNELKIKKLFENVVIIPAPPVKCKVIMEPSSDEQEDENLQSNKSVPLLSRSFKRKLFESSSSNCESDSNILITEPITESSNTYLKVDEELTSTLVLPLNLSNEDLPSECESNSKDFKEQLKVEDEDTKSGKEVSSSDNVRHQSNNKRMPNSIYFGDVQIPIHIFHSYEDYQESDDEVPDKLKSELILPKKSSNKKFKKELHSTRSELEKLKACVRAAHIKVKYSLLFKDCTNDQERIDVIHDLLADHGLDGKPTIAKCRRLHKKISKAKREVAQLDKSVIIASSDERILRSANITHKTNSFQDLYGQELLRKTMNTIRNLADSDSD